MKGGKKPTRAQMAVMESKRMKPANWLVIKDTPTELVCVARKSLEKDKKQIKVIAKGSM